jgi:hypothetical protein
MEYNQVLISSSEVSTEKVEKNYSNFLEMNEQERKLFLQYVIGRDFAVVESIRIIPVKTISKDLRSLVLKEDMD